MTDKEIEKALEVCGLRDLDCKDCPYFDNAATCLRLKDRDAYEYIQRLKAEKEQIRKETAKEIFQDLYNQANNVWKAIEWTTEDIKQYATKYGVEVDE